MNNTDENTPTTEEVRREWVQLRADGYALVTDNADSIAEAEFDRWLEAHDRGVAAKALNDAATDIYTPGTTAGFSLPNVRDWLRTRADSIVQP